MSQRNDLLRQTTVLVSALLAIAGAFVGSGAAGGTPIDEAAGGALAADATAIAPGAPAFAVWTLIYIGLITYAIWQSLAEQRTAERHRRLGYPVAASLLLNAAWILVVQFDMLALSVPLIVALLAVLVHAFVVTLSYPPLNLTDEIVSDGTIGLYLGWVCVATAANIGALLVSIGFDGAGLGEAPWAILVMVITGVVGVLIAIRGHGRVSPALALCWGLAWVAIARSWGALHSTPTALAAVAAIVGIAVVTVVERVRARSVRPRSATGGSGMSGSDAPAPSVPAPAPARSR